MPWAASLTGSSNVWPRRHFCEHLKLSAATTSIIATFATLTAAALEATSGLFAARRGASIKLHGSVAHAQATARCVLRLAVSEACTGKQARGGCSSQGSLVEFCVLLRCCMRLQLRSTSADRCVV